MAYTKTVWVNNQAPAINADNLNKIEDGIYNSVRYADAQSLSDAQKTQARANINAAPGGFGWGEELPRRVSTAAEVDAITANSVVWYGNDSINLVDGDISSYTRYAIVVTYKGGSASDKAQDVYCYGGGAHGDMMLHRGRFGNTWLPWEWVNPPLVLGVEYRTTERYLGKPVYVQAVNFGTLPNVDTKSVTWAAPDVVLAVLSVEATANWGEPLGLGASLSGTEITANKTTLYVKSSGNHSDNTAVFRVKYTKVTD